MRAVLGGSASPDYDRVIRHAAALVIVSVALALVAAVAAPAAPAPAGASGAPKTVDLPVSKELRQKLRLVFLRRNGLRGMQAVGPLWGRECVRAMEEMFRSRCIEHTRLGGWVYASALFVVRGGRPNEQTFTRRVGGDWRASGRYGYTPPLPCPVLRAWGREC